MKYMIKLKNLLEKRTSLKRLGFLAMSPALMGLGICSIKEICNNIDVKNLQHTEDIEDIKYTYNSRIELSPILLAQIDEYLEECKKR